MVISKPFSRWVAAMKDQTRPLLQDFQWLCDTSRVPLVKTKHHVPVTFPVPAAKWTPKFVLVMSRACVTSNAGYVGIIFKPIISYKQHCFLNRKRLCIVAWFVHQKLKVLRLLGGLDESSLRAGLLLQAQAGRSFVKLSWRIYCIFETLRLPCPHTGFAKMASQSWLHCMNLVIFT